MQKTVAIDFLPESVSRYRSGWAVVVVDVIRATTTAITAAASGRRCFTAPDVETALTIAKGFSHPLLAGEARGAMPAGFEMDNSPAQLMRRTDTNRPLILVSSSGTRVIHEAQGCEAVYLGCFRAYSRLAVHLALRHDRVAVIGAGSKGEFREEDQICCAWIAAALLGRGFVPENPQTLDVVNSWQDAPPTACLCSQSVNFLKRTGQMADLDFILGHIDDLPHIFEIRDGEVQAVQAPSTRTHRPRSLGSCV
jgi:2-phosphosulfolactate phosphatase